MVLRPPANPMLAQAAEALPGPGIGRDGFVHEFRLWLRFCGLVTLSHGFGRWGEATDGHGSGEHAPETGAQLG